MNPKDKVRRLMELANAPTNKEFYLAPDVEQMALFAARILLGREDFEITSLSGDYEDAASPAARAFFLRLLIMEAEDDYNLAF